MSDVHVCRSTGSYVGQVRGYGCRRWREVTRSCSSAEHALALAVRRMRRDDKRARALFVPDFDSSWYGPHVAMEASR